MDQYERMKAHQLYISDERVFEIQKRARRLTQQLNTMDRADFNGIAAVVRKLLGKCGKGVFINPPFYCDYGDRIEIGDGGFVNYNCVFIDTSLIKIGANAFIAPNVSIYTAGHPVHPAARNTLFEYGMDVTVGDNCWIGGNTVICPGVTIGDNCVIGAGSVVTKDIPAWSVAAGNPCRVLRKVTEADRFTYFRGIPADAEAVDEMKRRWRSADDDKKYPTAGT